MVDLTIYWYASVISNTASFCVGLYAITQFSLLYPLHNICMRCFTQGDSKERSFSAVRLCCGRSHVGVRIGRKPPAFRTEPRLVYRECVFSLLWDLRSTLRGAWQGRREQGCALGMLSTGRSRKSSRTACTMKPRVQRRIRLDFEIATKQEVLALHPDDQIVGCNFHFNQCNLRKIQAGHDVPSLYLNDSDYTDNPAFGCGGVRPSGPCCLRDAC